MVAIIKSGASIRNTLNYNEQKLKQNDARLIHSMNFAKDTEKLGFSDKLKTFQKLTSLNERTKLNSVHISLNFDPSEKLDKQTLQQIASTYMEKIGFGTQPCLVYEHHDSGHPHIHIVTTNIRRDGSRIKMQNIGKDRSEPARREIETAFNLVHAQKEQLKQVYEIKPVNAQKIQYGRTQTKRAITNVLDVILPTYKYASLPELNAVLKQYNVIADRGSEDSRTYKNNGLVYRVLDEKGKKVGSPVKASDIYNNPGLKFLNEKFLQNEPLKQLHKIRVKNAVDLAFIKFPGQSIDQLIAALQRERIQVVLRQNEKGSIYGITYVDYQTKCVFNGSDLGKAYSANQLQERCKQKLVDKEEQKLYQQHSISHKASIHEQPAYEGNTIRQEHQKSAAGEILKSLTQNENSGYVPSELRKEQFRKKKRKKRLRL